MPFMPLTRVEEGDRLVFAYLDETPDRDGERFDYASSKPHFEAWSNALKEATGGRNLGNIRAMHTRRASGGLVGIEFDDAAKRIALCGRVVDDDDWAKVRAGIYTGFSPGGKLDRFIQAGQRRYTARPTELSLVDLPSNPSATFTMIKGAGLAEEVAFVGTPEADDPVAVAEALAGAASRAEYAGMVLALGSGTLAKMWGADAELPGAEAFGGDADMAKRAFSSVERKTLAQDGRALPDGSFPIETRADVGNAVQAFGLARDPAAAKAHITGRATALDATDLLPADWDGATREQPMAKGFFTVSRLADLLAQLTELAQGVAGEAAAEADGSPLPAALAGWIGQGADILTGLASEESAEAVARLREAVAALPVLTDTNTPSDPWEQEGGAGMAKMAGAAVARMAKMAGDMAGLREDLAASRGHAAELGARLAALGAQPAPGGARLRVVDKVRDLGGGDTADDAEDARIAALPPGIEKATALHRQALRRQQTH